MKTTVELPDDLLRTLKSTAAQEGRSLKDVMIDLMRFALRMNKVKPAKKARSKSNDWPIIPSKPAKAGMEITPERIHKILYGSGE